MNDIIMQGHPLLNQPSEMVHATNTEVPDIVARMYKALNDKGGLGLSAVQIGVPLRIIIVRFDDLDEVMINPEVTRKLNREAVMHEGCLSVPKSLWRNVSRPAKCDVAYFTMRGELKLLALSAMQARIALHEIDHCDGRLISDP